MTNPQAEQFIALNQKQFNKLLTFIDFADEGKFTLGFIEINFPQDTDTLLRELQKHPQCQENQFEVLNFPDPDLRFILDEIDNELLKIIPTIPNNKKLVLILQSLDYSIGKEGDFPPVLQNLNYVRDAFLRKVPHPTLFCLPEYAITRLAKFAPDFWAWKSGIYHFETYQSLESQSNSNQDYLNYLLSKEKEYQETGKNLVEHISVLKYIANDLENKKNYTQAREYLEKAIKLTTINKNNNLQEKEIKQIVILKPRILYDIGSLYAGQGQVKEAITRYTQALELFKNNRDNIKQAETCKKIAGLYAQNKQLDESLSFYFEAQEKYQSLKNIDGDAAVRYEIAQVYIGQENLKSALTLSCQSHDIYDQIEDKIGKANALAQIAKIKYKQKEVKEAESLYKEALQIYEENDEKINVSRIQFELANINIDQNKQEDAIALLQSASAIYELPQVQGSIAQIGQVDEAISRYQKYQYRNRQSLLNKVRNYWIDGVLKTSLQGRLPIELGIEEALDLVEGSSRMISELLNYRDRPTLPPDTKVINKLEKMGEGATLLIVGEPGGGKTTTLLELACDLITRAERDINQPIPVVLDISSWGKKKQKIEDWIVEELTTKYQVSESLSKDWLKEQQLLMLLDNLDELSPKSRKLCVQALNQFTKKYGLTQIVVCSCIRDYEVLSNRLKFQGAIYLQPLKYEQVYHYIVSSGSKLATVNTVLQEDTALEELVNTPLMLSIIIHAFQEMSVKELSEIYSITERRRHLFNTYIEQVFYHRSARQPYSKELVIKWLTWLAKRMSQKSQNIFLIEHLQPSWLQTSIQKWMYHLGVGLINGVIGGAIGGLIGGLIGQRITVVIGGVITGLIAGFIGAVTEKIEPVETLKWSQRKAVIGLKNGLVIGFSVGLFVSLFGDIIGVFISVGLSTLLFFGLLGGTTGLVTNGLSGPQIDIEKRKFPNQGIWQSLVNAVILALISMLLSGLISEISGQALGLVAGLIGGMISGSIVSIASIQHFLLRLILWQNGSIPWNYSRFLNSATKRMFLQKKSGGSYIFIYHLLQEHFASL